MSLKYIKFFREIGIEDVESVGGKNASLGEMYQNLTAHGVKVPNGFAITAEAYSYVLEANDALEALHAELDILDPENVDDLQKKGKRCREIVYNCSIPDDLRL